MAYDLTRCPQTEEEFQEYFYTLIQRSYGANADGWEAVMEASQIPPGVGPGIQADASWPFFGLTQQYSGGPKGRIFLPAAIPDENGYYTRCIQYLDDAVGTYAKSKKQVDATSAGLVWSWYWIAGHEYAPVQGPDSTAPPESLEARVVALEADVVSLKEVSMAMGEEMDDLVQRVTTIEHALQNGLHAHGPINLPIVLESLTSLRCKGDIDVAVKPGQATPPNMDSPDPPDAATIALIRHLLEMRGDESES